MGKGKKEGRENWEAGPSSSHSSVECDEATREDSKLSVSLFVILEWLFHSPSKTAPAQPQPYTHLKPPEDFPMSSQSPSLMALLSHGKSLHVKETSDDKKVSLGEDVLLCHTPGRKQ